MVIFVGFAMNPASDPASHAETSGACPNAGSEVLAKHLSFSDYFSGSTKPIENAAYSGSGVAAFAASSPWRIMLKSAPLTSLGASHVREREPKG